VAYTRLAIRRRLRRQLGEPYDASDTAITAGTWRDAELNEDINDAVKQVAEDSITPDGHSSFIKEYQIRARSGVREYPLPEDSIEVLAVIFAHGGTTYDIPQVSFRQSIEGIVEASTNTIPVGWEYSRLSRFIITEGIATSGSATTITDLDRAGSAEYAFTTGTQVKDEEAAALAANDVVLNITDSSSGTIAAVTSATTLTFTGQAMFQGLTGGSRNNFELGDVYQVASAEHTRRNIRLILPPDATDESEAESYETQTTSATCVVGTNSGSTNVKQAQQFTLDRDTIASSVELKFGDDTGTPVGSVVVRIETDSSGPTGTLADFRAKSALSSITESDWNRFEFPNPFRLAAATTYNIVVEMPAQSGYYSSPASNYHTLQADGSSGYTDGAAYENTGSWAAASRDLLFKINKHTSSESIRVYYASYPSSLDADAQSVDLPDFLITPLLQCAKWKSLQKRYTSGVEVMEAYNMYISQMDDARRQIRRRDTQGYSRVSDVFLPSGGPSLVKSADPRRFVLPLGFTSR